LLWKIAQQAGRSQLEATALLIEPATDVPTEKSIALRFLKLPASMIATLMA